MLVVQVLEEVCVCVLWWGLYSLFWCLDHASICTEAAAAELARLVQHLSPTWNIRLWRTLYMSISICIEER